MIKKVIAIFNDTEANNIQLDEIKQTAKKLHIKVESIIYSNDISYSLDNGKYDIKDENNNTSIKLTPDDIKDTLIWIKLPLDINVDITHKYIIYLSLDLYSDNFLLINPLSQYSIAADKAKTYELLYKHNIYQPKTIIVSYKDTVDNKNFYEMLKDIYGNDKEENEYIVKIPNGHGGTGVLICTQKNIYSIIQALFEILCKKYGSEDFAEKLLIQEKIETKGNDGDIRIHILNINGRQKIIGTMKRTRTKNDFRSNATLGNSVEDVKLTKEQKELALNVAKIFNMTWCGIDIMQSKDNKNYVIEVNGSAGTKSMDRANNDNFIEIVFNSINELYSLTDAQEKWIDCVDKMYKWFCDNFDMKYDDTHGKDSETIHCDLIDCDVKNDCSGFVAACLKYAGYINEPIHWNAHLGSFNLDKKKNADYGNSFMKRVMPVQYMADLPDWEFIDYHFHSLQKGDIIYSNGHVTIVGNDDCTKLYDWGSNIVNNKKYELTDFYWPVERYDGIWRLKNT